MTIKFCALSSGSSGNCLFLATGKTSVLVDAGLSGKRVEKLMGQIEESPRSVTAILVTHDHIDHTSGVGVLSRRFDIPIYANSLTWQAMAEGIGKISPKNIREFNTDEEFNIADLCVKPYPVSHDAADPVGFTFCAGRVKIAVANDLGCVTPALEKEFKGSSFIMLESNHDTEMLMVGSYPWYLKRRIAGERGHLSNEDAGAALLRLAGQNTKAVLLGHLSKENNYPLLALETVKGILMQQGIEVGREMNIDLSFRDKISRIYTITDQEVY
ncbi:MAG: MBL fold metallo-hydrolase [Firmicutes bacterium]|nr:MBL fold metallo-hydrolase [Bacillota bacterium]